MGETKQTNIKNRSYYLCNNLIDLEDFDAKSLNIDKKLYKNIDIYYIGYSTIRKIGDYWSNYTVNPLYLNIDHASGYIECNSVECHSIEEKNGNKYLIFDSVDKNKEVLKKYADVWNGIKNKIKAINGDKCDYGEDYMKIKFNSDDDLPLNKQLKFHMMTIIIRSVFSEDGNFYPELFLDDALYEL